MIYTLGEQVYIIGHNYQLNEYSLKEGLYQYHISPLCFHDTCRQKVKGRVEAIALPFCHLRHCVPRLVPRRPIGN